MVSCFSGTLIGLDIIIRFSDITLFALGIPNMLGLLLLSNQVAHSLEKYWQTQVNSSIEAPSTPNLPI
ncbi:MAG: alanine:cation symporter family protein [Cyanobacteria bacterium J06642_11]